MSVVKHFLVIYDIPAAKADVVSFETDYAAALAAYEGAEKAYRWDNNTGCAAWIGLSGDA